MAAGSLASGPQFVLPRNTKSVGSAKQTREKAQICSPIKHARGIEILELKGTKAWM
jgi:hypothetical protein